MILFDNFKHRFPAWCRSAMSLQALRLRDLVIGIHADGRTWEQIARTSTVHTFWAEVRKQPQNLSLLLYFRKICLVNDGTATNVEQFISKLNKVMNDPQRRGLSSDFLEDGLRIVQNGPAPAKFKARNTSQFGKNVSTTNS